MKRYYVPDDCGGCDNCYFTDFCKVKSDGYTLNMVFVLNEGKCKKCKNFDKLEEIN